MALLKDNQEIRISGEELFRRPDLGPCELVNGRVILLAPTGHGHGLIEARLTARLVVYGEESGRGEVLGGEVGIYIRRDPDTVRGADIVFISKDRLARSQSSSYLDVAPELVVEVRSPEDRWSEIEGKLEEYFSIGVDRVWVLDPKTRRIFVYRSLADVQRFEADQILTDEELLPGFRLSLAHLFR